MARHIEIAHETISIDIVPQLGARKIQIDLSLAHAVSDEEVLQHDTALLSGIGHEQATIDGTARRLAEVGLANILVVEALPYMRVPPKPLCLANLAVQAYEAAAVHIKDQHGGEQPMNWIFESQAGVGAAKAAVVAPEAFDGKMAFWHPLGFTTVKNRSLHPWRIVSGLGMETLQPDYVRGAIHNIPVARRAARRILDDFRFGEWLINDEDYAYEPASRIFARREAASAAIQRTILPVVRYGAAADSRRDLLQIVASGRSAAVFVGSHDPVFPAERIRSSLDEVELGHLVQVIPGSHTPAATTPEQVRAIDSWFRADVLVQQ